MNAAASPALTALGHPRRDPPRILRQLDVGDRVPVEIVDRTTARRIDATALLSPGAGDDLAAYRAALDAAAGEFAAWDGRVVVLPRDGVEEHRLLVVDRYGQIYDARTASGLPSVGELEEWFKYLATACPECGVVDDPVREGPTP